MTILKLLAVDTSAKSASVAVTDGEKLLSECYVNAGLTHSKTLMPMIDNALSQAGLTLEDIDALCVNAGPGSFTGVRIGVSAVKGIAFTHSKPCAQVSTLESMAFAFADEDCTVCAAMDARRSQVYNAVFRVEKGNVSRLTEDRAVSAADLGAEMEKHTGRIYLCGDGAELCYEVFGKDNPCVTLPNEFRRYQRAYGTALAALSRGEFIPADKLAPVYIRPSQAERELSLRRDNKE